MFKLSGDVTKFPANFTLQLFRRLLIYFPKFTKLLAIFKNCWRFHTSLSCLRDLSLSFSDMGPNNPMPPKVNL